MPDGSLTRAPATVWFVAAGEPVFVVSDFVVSEPMSSMFEVVVTAASRDATFEPAEFVGKGAAFKLTHEKGDLIRAGICSQAALLTTQEEGSSTISYYRFVIVPALWRTTLRRNNRIFQHMTVPAIVSKVLDEWAIPHEKKLNEPHLEHEYIVQYGETDFAFLSRLLEEEGISYSFDHADKKGAGSTVTSLILHDQPHLNPSLGSFPYRETGHHRTHVAGENVVFDVSITQRMTFGKTTIRDFDHRLVPHVNLVKEGKLEGTAAKELVYEDYQYRPGAFRAVSGPADGTPIADDRGPVRTVDRQRDLRVQREIGAARHGQTTLRFNTSSLDWAPGTVLVIGTGAEPHPSPHVKEKKLLVIGRHLIGTGTSQGAPHQSVVAVPADVPHVPPRTTPKPRILGLQSAIVVGPASQEIHTDELGRVRVRFHWDREHPFDDTSSCWIRVSQASAGSSFGFITIPRVGHEVLVAFYEGDPDRPVVVGRVFNRTSRVPYELAAHKTRSGWRTESSGGDGRSRAPRGYNELMFEDAVGRELVSIRAEKNLSTLAKGSESRDVGGDRTTRIGQTDVVHVGKLSQRLVGSHTGLEMSEEGSPDIVLSTGGASIRLAGDDIFIEAKGKLTVHTGKGALVTSLATVDIVGGPEVHINCNDGAAGEVGAAPRPAPLGPAAPPGGGDPIPAPYDPQRSPAPPPPPLGFEEIQVGEEEEEEEPEPQAAAPTDDDGGLSHQARGIRPEDDVQSRAAVAALTGQRLDPADANRDIEARYGQYMSPESRARVAPVSVLEPEAYRQVRTALNGPNDTSEAMYALPNQNYPNGMVLMQPDARPDYVYHEMLHPRADSRFMAHVSTDTNTGFEEASTQLFTRRAFAQNSLIPATATEYDANVRRIEALRLPAGTLERAYFGGETAQLDAAIQARTGRPASAFYRSLR